MNANNGVWFCHHCNAAGSIARGWKCEYEELPTVDKIYIKPTQSLSETDLQWFKDTRGLSAKTLTSNSICVGIKCIKDVYMEAYGFPYMSRLTKSGTKILNIKWRTKDKLFVSEKGYGRHMYRWFSLYDDNNKPLDSFIITEGEIDALTFVEAGFNAVTSVPDGAPSNTDKDLSRKLEVLDQIKDVYRQASRVIIAVDNDESGKRLERELAKRFGASVCYTVKYPEGCKDINDVLMMHGVQSVIDTVSQAKPVPVAGITDAYEIQDEVYNLYDSGVTRGVSAGWSKFHELYSVRTGEMNIVTGIPSHGKSSFIDAMAVNLARLYGWKFAVFSPENYPLRRHAKNYIELVSGEPFFSQDNTRLCQDELEKYILWVGEHFKFITDDSADTDMSLDGILEKVACCINRYNVKGFILDPWNEVEHNRPHYQTETEYISGCLSKIRRFVRSYNIAAWIIVHPSKPMKKTDGRYAIPASYDVSGSAHWRNKADNILCVYRPSLYSTICIVEVQKIKFREVGKCGRQTFIFSTKNGQYEETHNMDSKISSN